MDFFQAADDHRPVPAYPAEQRDVVSGSCDHVRPVDELADAALAHPRSQGARQEHKVPLGRRESPA